MNYGTLDSLCSLRPICSVLSSFELVMIMSIGWFRPRAYGWRATDAACPPPRGSPGEGRSVCPPPEEGRAGLIAPCANRTRQRQVTRRSCYAIGGCGRYRRFENSPWSAPTLRLLLQLTDRMGSIQTPRHAHLDLKLSTSITFIKTSFSVEVCCMTELSVQGSTLSHLDCCIPPRLHLGCPHRLRCTHQ